jgi:hypothetical protein
MRAKGGFYALACRRSTRCFGVGALSALWNGTGWSAIAAPTRPASVGLQGVAWSSATSAVAVGAFSPATGLSATVAELWNGKTWTDLPTPNP